MPIAATRARSQTRYGRSQIRSTRAFIEAGRQAGYPLTDDVNGHQQEGFGRMDMTVNDGRRWSARRTPICSRRMKRPNLAVRDACAGDAASSSRAGAPSAWISPGRRDARGARAARGRSSRGPINSPQLLKLSGIGPAAELREPRHRGRARPAGRRREPAGPSRVLFPGRLHAADHALRLHGPPRQGADRRALAPFKDGLGATNHFESCGFIRSPPGRAATPTSSTISCRSP